MKVKMLLFTVLTPISSIPFTPSAVNTKYRIASHVAQRGTVGQTYTKNRLKMKCYFSMPRHAHCLFVLEFLENHEVFFGFNQYDVLNN